MTISIKLNWEKRINKEDFDSNKEFLVNNGGIYIWIFKGKPQRVTYIGEANNFANRFVTHFSSILTGRWNTYDMNGEDDFVKYLRSYYHEKALKQIKAENKCKGGRWFQNDL